MKINEFKSIFISQLHTQKGCDSLGKAQITLERTLDDAFKNISDVSEKSLDLIRAQFYQKLDEYAGNFSTRTLPYLRDSAAFVAKAAFEETAQKVGSVTSKKEPFFCARHDFNYSGYTQGEIKDLQFAENCCAFPKLALHLSQEHRMGLYAACQAINQGSQQQRALSCKDVV